MTIPKHLAEKVDPGVRRMGEKRSTHEDPTPRGAGRPGEPLEADNPELTQQKLEAERVERLKRLAEAQIGPPPPSPGRTVHAASQAGTLGGVEPSDAPPAPRPSGRPGERPDKAPSPVRTSQRYAGGQQSITGLSAKAIARAEQRRKEAEE